MSTSILPDLRHIETGSRTSRRGAHPRLEDHIGAIPFLLKLRPDIPVVGSRFTLALVAAKVPRTPDRPKFTEVAEDNALRTVCSNVIFLRSIIPIPDAGHRHPHRCGNGPANCDIS